MRRNPPGSVAHVHPPRPTAGLNHLAGGGPRAPAVRASRPTCPTRPRDAAAERSRRRDAVHAAAAPRQSGERTSPDASTAFPLPPRTGRRALLCRAARPKKEDGLGVSGVSGPAPLLAGDITRAATVPGGRTQQQQPAGRHVHHYTVPSNGIRGHRKTDRVTHRRDGTCLAGFACSSALVAGSW